MTYEHDPMRWSDSANPEVPDGLRELMQAGASETPSAAKLAALSSKISASGATASAAGVGATKLWIAGLAIGAAVLSGVGLTLLEPSEEAAAPQASSPVAAPRPGRNAQPAPLAPTVTPGVSAEPLSERDLEAAPEGHPQVVPGTGARPRPQPARRAAQASSNERSNAESSELAVTTPKTKAQGEAKPAATAQRPATPASEQPRRTAMGAVNTGAATAKRPSTDTADRPVHGSSAPDREVPKQKRGTGDGPNEVQLLQHARRALAVDPGRALELAAEHAARFPNSQFAQERAAVVIEALTRAGKLERARKQARTFIERYPSSAHAHRFQERLSL